MLSHARLMEILRAQHAANPNPLCGELDIEEDDALLRKYFLNFRGNDHTTSKGLRLTTFGLTTFSCFFKSNLVELPEGYRPKNQHVVFLDRKATMPWHLRDNFLTLFEDELAMRAKLVGDLDLLMTVFDPN